MQDLLAQLSVVIFQSELKCLLWSDDLQDCGCTQADELTHPAVAPNQRVRETLRKKFPRRRERAYTYFKAPFTHPFTLAAFHHSGATL